MYSMVYVYNNKVSNYSLYPNAEKGHRESNVTENERNQIIYKPSRGKCKWGDLVQARQLIVVVKESIMMVSIHTMADGKKAYYIQLYPTMTLLDVLHVSLDTSTRDD